MDPFWAAVRRRHPDVDIVVVPDPALAGPAVGAVEATDAELGDALDLTSRRAALVWEAATGSDEPPETRLAYGPWPDTVVARSQASTHLDSAPVVDLAVADRQHLTASYAEATGTFRITLTSDPLHVGVERARRLVRGSRGN